MAKNDPTPTRPSLLGASAPLVSPLYQTSVYTLPDLDTLDQIMDGEEPGFIYARDGHPNAKSLAMQVAALEKADWAVLCGSGMAAISACVLASVKHGERIVASNRLYGKTTALLQRELERYGVRSTFVDTCDLEQVQTALKEPTKLLLVETMSNPLLRVVDLAALAKLARKARCTFAVDNTFATPILARPLELGADLVIESMTKMMGGHSDVTLGVICGNGASGWEMGPLVSTWGLAANPFDCWLAERGLLTLALRMQASSQNAVQLAEWLPQQQGVARVVYPSMAEHPDRVLAEQQFGGVYGNMLCFELKGGREAVNAFLRRAPEIPFSPSLGHTHTTLSHPASTSHRYVDKAEKKRQGITDGLIRLSVGIEPIEQIQVALQKGL